MPEGGPEEAVEASQRRPRPLAFQYGDLLSEREDLQGGIAATADEHADGCQDCEQEIEHGSTLVTDVMLEQSAAPDRNVLILKTGCSSGYTQGPKGPSQEVIAAVVDMKRRNPTWGSPRIAQQIALAFGIPTNKDVVRRILA